MMKLTKLSLALALAFLSWSKVHAEIYMEDRFYSSNLKMRESRKVGLGVVSGGTAGAVGLQIELNVEDQDGAALSFGTGQGYSTFSVAWKHNFEGLFLNPYTTVGWSRWYSSAGTGAGSSYVLEQVVSLDELRSGRFGADFVAGALGAQYNQLDGELMGAGFFGQIEILYAPAVGKLIPSAGLGAVYYF